MTADSASANATPAPITGESFSISRGSFALWAVLYVVGVIVGGGFILLWFMGEAEVGLMAAGVCLVAISLYLLPEALRPAASGEALILGNDRAQYVRGGTEVIGQIPYGNVNGLALNAADGGQSLWVQLETPESPDTFWPGGPSLMQVIHEQCGYHIVLGKHVQVDARTLLQKLERLLEASQGPAAKQA